MTPIPKEMSTAVLGVTLAAASHMATELLLSSTTPHSVVRTVATFSCCAAAMAGAGVAVYSAFHACKKMISEGPDLQKTITVTALALGGVSLALARALTEHFWILAPSFSHLRGDSMAFCIATNFAWRACAIAGLGSSVFTIYAAYRAGQASYCY